MDWLNKWNLVKYVTQYNQLRDLKIEQHQRQLLLVQSVKNSTCANLLIVQFYDSLHKHMIQDSEQLLKTDFWDVPTKSLESIDRRNKFLDQLEASQNRCTICQDLPSLIQMLSK